MSLLTPDIIGVTVLICSYIGEEFVQIGYYVNNDNLKNLSSRTQQGKPYDSPFHLYFYFIVQNIPFYISPNRQNCWEACQMLLMVISSKLSHTTKLWMIFRRSASLRGCCNARLVLIQSFVCFLLSCSTICMVYLFLTLKQIFPHYNFSKCEEVYYSFSIRIKS